MLKNKISNLVRRIYRIFCLYNMAKVIFAAYNLFLTVIFELKAFEFSIYFQILTEANNKK